MQTTAETKDKYSDWEDQELAAKYRKMDAKYSTGKTAEEYAAEAQAKYAADEAKKTANPPAPRMSRLEVRRRMARGNGMSLEESGY